VEQRADAGDFAGGLKSRRELGVEVKRVPVHLRKSQYLCAKLVEWCGSRMAAQCERRGNAPLALKILEARINGSGRPVDPKQGREVIKFHHSAAPHGIIIFIDGAVASRHRRDVAQGVIFHDLQHVDGGNAAEPVEQSFALVFQKRRALVQHDSPRELHPGVEEKLANGFSGPACIVPRHERVLASHDGVLNLAQSILKAFATRTVDVAASEDDVVALLGIPVDAEAEPDIGRVFLEAA
jgi:hypothetical protein